MNDLYAIDPKSPRDIRDVVQLSLIFNVSTGRFVADFPDGWGKLLYSRLKSMSDIDVMKFVEMWKQGCFSLIPSSIMYRSDLTWPENALFLARCCNLKKIIGEAGRAANISAPIDAALLEPDFFPDSSGEHIESTPIGYVNSIKPMLYTSPKIVLVDPFFSLSRVHYGRTQEDRRMSFFVQLLKACVQARRVEYIDIYSNLDKSRITDADIATAKERSGAEYIEIEVFNLMTSSSLGAHARYCLGRCKGLQFDYGFDILKSGNKNYVHWIGKSALEPLLKLYNLPSSIDGNFL